jgi:hypothetical protein
VDLVAIYKNFNYSFFELPLVAQKGQLAGVFVKKELSNWHSKKDSAFKKSNKCYMYLYTDGKTILELC